MPTGLTPRTATSEIRPEDGGVLARLLNEIRIDSHGLHSPRSRCDPNMLAIGSSLEANQRQAQILAHAINHPSVCKHAGDNAGAKPCRCAVRTGADSPSSLLPRTRRRVMCLVFCFSTEREYVQYRTPNFRYKRTTVRVITCYVYVFFKPRICAVRRK
jgi:hypothetical protein